MRDRLRYFPMSGVSVTQPGWGENANQDKILVSPDEGLAAVFDGFYRAGKRASGVAATHFREYLSDRIDELPENLTNNFAEIDKQLQPISGSTTATVVRMRRTEHGTRIISNNVGDSPAILIDLGRTEDDAFELTESHTVRNQFEVARMAMFGMVESPDGFVYPENVFSGISTAAHGIKLSRSLGEHGIDAVMFEPSIGIATVPAGEERVLLVASDGVITGEPDNRREVIAIVREIYGRGVSQDKYPRVIMQDIAKTLVAEMVSKTQDDGISVIAAKI